MNLFLYTEKSIKLSNYFATKKISGYSFVIKIFKNLITKFCEIKDQVEIHYIK